MDELHKVVAVLFSAITVLSALVKWGIKSYFEKAKELEKIKENWTKDALSQLKQATSGLRTDLCQLSDSIRRMEVEIASLSEMLTEMKSDQDELKKRTNKFKNTQLVRFNEDLYFLKKKE